jgi:membrane fusion protein, multidrug efflux system
MAPMQIRNVSSLIMFMIALGCGNRNDEQVAELTIPVRVEQVSREDVAAYISATGTVKARHEEAVMTEVEGILTIARNLKAGSAIRKGQLLAELTNPAYLLEVRVESKKLAMDNAQRDLEKKNALYSEGGITENELETARRSALDAKLNYDAALLEVEKIRIFAPISGTVTGLQKSADGTRVASRFQLCTIMDYVTINIPIKLPNTDLGLIQLGQEVLISNYALPDDLFKGTVQTIDPTIDPQTRTFIVTIQTANPQFRLRPGMFVKTDIIREQHEQVIVIPKNTLQIRNNQSVVFVVEGAIAQMREVTSGIEAGDNIEIVTGLADGERLVIQGHETLRDKAKVRVLE